jgi:glycosyltransferase involved in cell wall biosynthesis
LPTELRVEREAARPRDEIARPGARAAAVATNDGPEPWRLLTVARLHPRKGQLEVVRALGLLPADLRARITYQLVGVGSHGYQLEIEEACARNGVRSEFLGALDDRQLASVYAQATVYVQASRTLARSVEGFGLTFLEAASYGCPVVAYRSGGVGEAVLDEETGLLVPEDDLHGLAGALRRLLEDRPLRSRLGTNGAKFAASTRWEDAANAIRAMAWSATGEKIG